MRPERLLPELSAFSTEISVSGITVLQEEQRLSTLVPHFMQNSASAGLS